MNLPTTKMLLFLAVMVYASIMDVRTRNIRPHVYFLLFLIGLIQVSLSSLFGAAFIGILFCIIYVFANLGGADVKIAALIGFIWGATNGLIALIIGLFCAVISQTVYCRIRRLSPRSTPFPLIPGITAGCVILILLKGFAL